MRLNFLAHNAGTLLFGDASVVELWEIPICVLNVNLLDHEVLTIARFCRKAANT